MVDLSETPVTDAGVSALARLENLESLDLSETKVTGKTLAAVAQWKHLREVTVTGVPLGTGDLKALSARPDLTVRGIEVVASDESLKELRKDGLLHLLVKNAVRIFDLEEADDPNDAQNQFRVLSLADSEVTDAGMRE